MTPVLHDVGVMLMQIGIAGLFSAVFGAWLAARVQVARRRRVLDELTREAQAMGMYD